jgi:hypothetical protein
MRVRSSGAHGNVNMISTFVLRLSAVNASLAAWLTESVLKCPQVRYDTLQQ